MLPWRGPTIIMIPFEKGYLDAGHLVHIRASNRIFTQHITTILFILLLRSLRSTIS